MLELKGKRKFKNKNVKEKIMTEKYLNLENGKIIEVEIFKGKNGKTIYEIGREIISNEKYKEIFEDFPEIDVTISAYISDKNLRVKMPNESEEWTSDEVKKYFTENEVYIQFYDYYKKVNIIKKTDFFISEVNEVVDCDGEKEENEFYLNARLEIDKEIVRLKEYLAKNKLNLLKVLVKEKDVENEYY